MKNKTPNTAHSAFHRPRIKLLPAKQHVQIYTLCGRNFNAATNHLATSSGNNNIFTRIALKSYLISHSANLSFSGLWQNNCTI
jgi:hypothetical protein